MSFQSYSSLRSMEGIGYNSPESKSFLEMYNECVKTSLLPDPDYIPKKTFVPSSIRCKRIQWFRLRGTKPDKVKEPDVTLSHIAGVGTHCHEVIQERLELYLGKNWLSVPDYLEEHNPGYEYTVESNGHETKVEIKNPPVRFSCDGLINYQGTTYILEIKTSELSSMKKLVAPKAEHLNQIMTYCTLMGVDDAMVLYQDRQYGSLKCFTHHLLPSEKREIVNTFEEVQEAVRRNIAPEKLPHGDKWCSPSYCNYYQTCKRWG